MGTLIELRRPTSATSEWGIVDRDGRCRVLAAGDRIEAHGPHATVSGCLRASGADLVLVDAAGYEHALEPLRGGYALREPYRARPQPAPLRLGPGGDFVRDVWPRLARDRDTVTDAAAADVGATLDARG